MLIELAQRGLLIALQVALPLLAAAVLAGLVMSAFQAAMRQSDPALAVAPRLLAVGGAVLIFGGWMAAVIAGFWRELWHWLPHIVR